MMKRCIAFLLVLASWSFVTLQAQELQAKINVNASRVGSQIDKKVFQTLQNALNTFLNNRKWTGRNLPAKRENRLQFPAEYSRSIH